MVNKDIVTSKLGELAERIDQIRIHRKPAADELAGDRAARDLVSFTGRRAGVVCAVAGSSGSNSRTT